MLICVWMVGIDASCIVLDELLEMSSTGLFNDICQPALLSCEGQNYMSSMSNMMIEAQGFLVPRTRGIDSPSNHRLEAGDGLALRSLDVFRKHHMLIPEECKIKYWAG
jgi:hypothetical protein